MLYDWWYLVTIVMTTVCVSLHEASISGRYCRTPLEDAGQCVSLKFCPEVVNLFRYLHANIAKQYSSQLHRICGNRVTFDNYPIVCCVRVSAEATVSDEIRQTLRTTPAPEITTRKGNLTHSSHRHCDTVDLQPGICLPLKECSQLSKSTTEQPEEIFGIQVRIARTLCGNEDLLVCCPSRQSDVANRAKKKNKTDDSQEEEEKEEEEEEEEEDKNKRKWGFKQMDPIQSVHQLAREENGCGLVNLSTPKIVGGEESTIGAWPWLALIGYNPWSVQPFRCAGSLISARHVITAAHCIRVDLSFVRLGEYDLTTETETEHLDVNVIKYVKHPDYGVRKDRRSDLAILLLEKTVQFTDYIVPICMPTDRYLLSKSYVNAMPYVAGWGYTVQGGAMSSVLREAQLPVLKNEVCLRMYTALLPNISAEQFDEAVLCAGYIVGGKDTCKGDSGGPLMIPEVYKGIVRYYLIGIVSYGHGCGKIPGVYISTQYWMPWILEQIATI